MYKCIYKYIFVSLFPSGADTCMPLHTKTQRRDTSTGTNTWAGHLIQQECHG